MVSLSLLMATQLVLAAPPKSKKAPPKQPSRSSKTVAKPKPTTKPTVNSTTFKGGQPIVTAQKLQANCPLRLGGVFLSGLGKDNYLSAENRKWIAENCDVAAFKPNSVTSNDFREITKLNRLFTPLLFLYASSLYEKDHGGSVGGWDPAKLDWTLRNNKGEEVRHPDQGGHWMDFANTDWATHWSKQGSQLLKQYGAYGIVIAELPLGNNFVTEELQKYKTVGDRISATRDWLRAARPGIKNFLIPSASGFDLPSGNRAVSVDLGGVQTPTLSGRVWDDFYKMMDGAWSEGWVSPYWADAPVSESVWKMHLEAADRAGWNGQVFICAASYQNDAELEFALASYLLVVHNQGRVVFQPMPRRANEASDAGLDLSVLQREMREKPNYFRPLLGLGMQQRHPIRVQGGFVWKRGFQFGEVYVNSDDEDVAYIAFGGKMRRLDNSIVREVTLPPRTAAILFYTNN